jgi:hypothetical protein
LAEAPGPLARCGQHDDGVGVATFVDEGADDLVGPLPQGLPDRGVGDELEDRASLLGGQPHQRADKLMLGRPLVQDRFGRPRFGLLDRGIGGGGRIVDRPLGVIAGGVGLGDEFQRGAAVLDCAHVALAPHKISA